MADSETECDDPEDSDFSEISDSSDSDESDDESPGKFMRHKHRFGLTFENINVNSKNIQLRNNSHDKWEANNSE